MWGSIHLAFVTLTVVSKTKVAGITQTGECDSNGLRSSVEADDDGGLRGGVEIGDDGDWRDGVNTGDDGGLRDGVETCDGGGLRDDVETDDNTAECRAVDKVAADKEAGACT